MQRLLYSTARAASQATPSSSSRALVTHLIRTPVVKDSVANGLETGRRNLTSIAGNTLLKSGTAVNTLLKSGSVKASEILSNPAFVSTRNIETFNFDSGQIPGTKERAALALVYTCGQCDHREVKKISKNSYQNGIVIVQCSNCKKRHLISDQLNWFGDEKSNVESLAAEKGQSIIKSFEDPKTGEIKLRVVQKDGTVVELPGHYSQEDVMRFNPEMIREAEERGIKADDVVTSSTTSLSQTPGDVLQALAAADLLHMEGTPPEIERQLKGQDPSVSPTLQEAPPPTAKNGK